MNIWVLLLFVFALLLGLGFGIAAIWMWINTYDFKVRIRELTSSKVRLIHDVTGKISKDRDNIYYLKLFRKKGIHNLLPLPPDDSIDYDPKSKKRIVECWYSDTTGYVYVKDKGIVTGLQPVTTNQRLLMVSQIKKAEARKKQSWMEYIPLITSGIVLVLVIAVILIFWGQALKPMIEIGQNYEGLLDKTNVILEKAIQLSGGGQVVNGVPPA